MKHNNLFLWLLGLTVCWLASCSEEDGRVKYPYSCPELSGLQFSTTDQTPAADSLYFSVKIHDPETPLSTLEVKLMTGETLVSSQSIRTKGTDVSIVEKGIYIPFEAGLEENQEAKVILTAINVEGSEVTQTFDFHITRPQIPEVLYLHYNGEVVEMTRSAENPYLYLTEVSGSEEGYPMELTGKISTTESLDDAELIWGAAEKSNTAVLIEASGPSFAFDYRDWFVEQITFDVMTFKLGVVGYQKNLKIKETELNSTILSHLEMSNDLVDAVKTDWNAKGIFKRIEKEEDKQIVVDSYCTRPYVQDVILRYCQNRSIFKTKFAIIDGMLLE